MTRRYYNAFGEVTQISGTRNKAGATYDEFRYYDKAGRLSASVDMAGFLTSWTYDGVGNLASRKEFAKAVVYAQSILHDPVKKKAFAAKLKKGKSIYHAAIKEFHAKNK